MFPMLFGFRRNACEMLLLSFAFMFGFSGVRCDLIVDEEDLTVLVGNTTQFTLSLTAPLTQEANVLLEVPVGGVIRIDPQAIAVSPQTAGPWKVNVTGLEGGHVLIYANVTPDIVNADKAFIRVTVQYSEVVSWISAVIGWIYFTAWSISFYPQMYENFVRKSVVGLNFDFLALNIVGFIMYALFNMGLYYVPEVEEEYFHRHPRGLNPVQLNDIVFAVHAVFATVITILQCFCYERGSQRVSTTARSILTAFFLIFVTCLGLALFNYIHWLDFLYDCSYIKLTITLIKYIPQAFMNYQRKSTVGWSIGNVLLDFTGGLLSMGQMILNAYNYNDWISIFGDPTKFGLGLFSVFFDILFIVQHYILYRNPYEPIPGDLYVQVADSERASTDAEGEDGESEVKDPGGSSRSPRGAAADPGRLVAGEESLVRDGD